MLSHGADFQVHSDNRCSSLLVGSDRPQAERVRMTGEGSSGITVNVSLLRKAAESGAFAWGFECQHYLEGTSQGA